MLKLYKEIDSALHYHEAWASGDQIIEHWGRVGSRGDERRHSFVASAEEEDQAIENVLRDARANGFVELNESEFTFLIIEFEVSQDNAATDLEKRHELEERLDEMLGWTGLGHCDGGSIGSGTMEVACMVVDVDIAKRVISDDLAGTKFADYARIYAQ